MRQTMRPVSLGRVIETTYVTENSPQITDILLIDQLGISKRRAREILLETERMHLLKENEEGYVVTDLGHDLIEAIRTGDWSSIHRIMMKYDFYEAFYTAVNDIGPAERVELLEYLADSDVRINQTTIDVMSDWTERIGCVQRNIFTGRYYAISDESRSFIASFLSEYDKLNRKAGLTLRQRYVEIPRLREAVCEELFLSRDEFDKEFIEIYIRNIGLLELSGAPITTHAKKSQKKIKSVVFQEMPDCISMKLTSECYLKGIVYGSKNYYYVAVHGRDLK